MKTFLPARSARRRPGEMAFTLVEMSMVAGIFGFLILGIIAVQIFALRVYSLGAAKLTATTSARQTLNAIRDTIRSSKIVYVGNYTNGNSFVRVPDGSLQQGNAMEIGYLNSTNFLIFYLDTTQPTNTLYSISNNIASTLTVEARYMTNYNCFTAEDYRGNVLLNYLNNPVIHVDFEFDQLGYAVGYIGNTPGDTYEFYHLSTRIMRRAKE